MTTSILCQQCGTRRKPDTPDYSPLDVFTEGDWGWTSGDDGEWCGPCMMALHEWANR